jgi:hypothetical protein
MEKGEIIEQGDLQHLKQQSESILNTLLKHG